jgi:hypothetical protein
MRTVPLSVAEEARFRHLGFLAFYEANRSWYLREARNLVTEARRTQRFVSREQDLVPLLNSWLHGDPKWLAELHRAHLSPDQYSLYTNMMSRHIAWRTDYPSPSEVTESPPPSTDQISSNSSVKNAADIVSLAAAFAAVASVIRNVIGSVKDSLDIKKHLKDDARPLSKNTSHASNIDPANPSPKDHPDVF